MSATSTDETHRGVRWIELGRGLWGATLLIAPEVVLTHAHRLDIDIDTTSVVVARVLGARQLGQAALSGIRPSPEVLAMGVWVDAVHALSAVGLAAADRYRVRAGLIDAAVAVIWAAAVYRDLRGAGPTPPHHDRRRDRLARILLGMAPGGAALLRQVETDRQRAARRDR